MLARVGRQQRQTSAPSNDFFRGHAIFFLCAPPLLTFLNLLTKPWAGPLDWFSP